VIQPRALTLPALPLATLSFTALLAGCPGGGGTACTTEARTSVSLTVLDAEGDPVLGADASYVSAERSGDCDEGVGGVYSCGYELAGDLTLTVLVDGAAAWSQTVTVDEDECHVITEQVTANLEPDASRFSEPRVYANPLFDTPEECDDLLAQGVNCWQVVDFCPSGEATIILTDIINAGTYAVDDATVTTEWDVGDAPASIVFTLDANADTLTDDLDGAVWERQTGAQWSPNCM
jgi:hypothetical protein